MMRKLGNTYRLTESEMRQAFLEFLMKNGEAEPNKVYDMEVSVVSDESGVFAQVSIKPSAG
jgi:hypothetical protein